MSSTDGLDTVQRRLRDELAGAVKQVELAWVHPDYRGAGGELEAG